MAGQKLVDLEELQKKLAAERASIASWVDGRRGSAEAINQEHSHMVKEHAGETVRAAWSGCMHCASEMRWILTIVLAFLLT